MLNRVQSRAGLAVIYIAPRNLDQIGACASYLRNTKTIRSVNDRCNEFQNSSNINNDRMAIVFIVNIVKFVGRNYACQKSISWVNTFITIGQRNSPCC